MALLRERVPAGAAALLGVALALPSVVAPTWRLTTLDSERGIVLFDQQDWSWGRSEVLGAGGALVQDLWNPFGLVLLVGLLGLTAAGAVAWALTPAPWAAAAAPVASAALLGRLGRRCPSVTAARSVTTCMASPRRGRRRRSSARVARCHRAGGRRGAHGPVARRMAYAVRLGREAAWPRHRRS